MHGVHDDLWDEGADGVWVECPECGKLFFWELPLFQWKVAHDFVLLCSAKCGLKFFPKHPELHHGVQRFMKLFVDGEVLEPMFGWSRFVGHAGELQVIRKDGSTSDL